MSHLFSIVDTRFNSLDQIDDDELIDAIWMTITVRAVEYSYRYSPVLPLFILKWKKVWGIHLLAVMEEDIFPKVTSDLLKEIHREIEILSKAIKSVFITKDYEYFLYWLNMYGFIINERSLDECLERWEAESNCS